MIQVKTVLAQILSELSLNLGIDSVTDNGDGTYTLSVDNTQYLNNKMKFEIDSVEYTVEDFTINDSLLISGPSAPTTGIKTLTNPTFVHGKYKAVNKQLQRRQPSDYLPLVWMYELLPRTQPEDSLSLIDSEGDVRLYFCMSSEWRDWDSGDHYDEVFDPLNNVIDAFVEKIRNSPIIGEVGTIERTNHAKFSTGGATIDGGQESAILPTYVSAVEVVVDLPILTTAQSCSGLKDTSCPPGLVRDQSGNELGLVDSGGFLELNIGEGTVENSDGSYSDTVASGDTLVLPDISVTINGEAQADQPSVKDLDLSYVETPDYEFHFTADDVVESGGSVSQLNDQSSNGNDAVQSNGAYQPSYNSSDANFNGEPSITLDSEYFVFTRGITLPFNTDFWVMWTANGKLTGRNDLLGNVGGIMGRWDFFTDIPLMRINDLRQDITAGGASYSLSSGNPMSGAKIHLITVVGSDATYYINGTLTGSTLTTNGATSYFSQLGAASTVRCNFDLCDIRAKRSYDLSEINSVGSELATKYGLTWNTIV